MTPMDLVLVFLFIFFIELMALCIYLYYRMVWNIPVTLLRFVGNKGRPTMIHRRAKKVIHKGIPRLYVQGYKDPVRDYLSENYYPTIRGKFGGLILWEFEDGLLAPALSQKEVKALGKEEKMEYEAAMSYFKGKPVTFEFDKQLYHDLKLKVVDDVDQEFMLQEMYRVDQQYAGGWKDFFLKYGGHMTVIIMGLILLTGVVVGLDKAPEFAAQCAATAQEVARQTWLEATAANVAPPG